MKPFEKWLTQEVEMTFGLKEVKKPKVLTDWLASDEAISEKELERFSDLQLRLLEKVDYWNEDELKFFFIGEFLNQINFNHNGTYSAFSQRTIAVEALDIQQNKVPLRGRIEWLVATGKQIPMQPFFFINEYKPQLKSQNDPKGQLLISMFATQQINQKKRVLYGAYVLGKFWQFITLDNTEYSVSSSFDATDDKEILQIVRILKRRKRHIETELGII
jgi:hypothetical protein